MKKLFITFLIVLITMQMLCITSFAETINEFPPQRPNIGNMKITMKIGEGPDVFLGLRTDGTINIKTDLNSYGDGITSNLKDRLLKLTDVIDIACIYKTVIALKSDGTLYVGHNTPEDVIFNTSIDYLQPLKEAETWTDIVSIACGDSHLVGLKADGTVVATGENSKGQCDVMGWNNVSKIYAKYNETLAIKKDGTILATGAVENYSELRKMENVESLFYNEDGFLVNDTPHNYQALLADGTITVKKEIFVKDEKVLTKILDYNELQEYRITELNIDKIFNMCGFSQKINSVQAGDSYFFILDEFGDLYKLSFENYICEVTKMEEKIISFIVYGNNYYALDKNGQIWSDQSAFTSSDWILTTNITYDGKKIDSDVPPYVKDGRTLAPIRAILETLGMTVSWDATTQTATAVKGSKTISVSINSNIAYVNGEQKTLDVPAEITSGRTFVPVRFFGEALGMNVDWDSYTKTVIID